MPSYLVDRMYVEICHPTRYKGWLADVRIVEDRYTREFRLMGLYPGGVLDLPEEDKFVDQDWTVETAVEVTETLAECLHANIKLSGYGYCVRVGHPFERIEEEEEDYPSFSSKKGKEGERMASYLRDRYFVEIGYPPSFKGWLVDVIVGSYSPCVRGVFPGGVLQLPEERFYFAAEWDYRLISLVREVLSDMLDANVRLNGFCYPVRTGHPFERREEESPSSPCETT